MAFCAKCGSPLEEGAEFCTACGRKVGTAVVNQTSNNGNVSEGHQVFYGNMDPNSEEAKRFKITGDFAVFKDYFGKKSASYNEFDSTSLKIEDLEYKNRHNIIFAPGLICTIAGLMAFVFLYTIGFKSVEEPITFGRFLRTEDAASYLRFGLPFFIFGIFFLVCYVLAIVVNKNKIKKLTVRKNELIDEIQQYYRQYPGIVPVGIEYTTPDMIDKIGEMIRTGKASSFEGALKQLELEKHHTNLELANWARVDAINNVADAINRL